jgi:predicted alpha-1,6-mannanase (GH76 family)
MNIFVLDPDAATSARMMCNKHVVKMILESCQLLSTAHHVLDGEPVMTKGKKKEYKTYSNGNTNICRCTMINMHMLFARNILVVMAKCMSWKRC